MTAAASPRPRRASSLRRRLTIGIFASTTFVMALAAVAVYGVARAAIVAQFDATLHGDAIAVEAIAEFSRRGLEMELAPGQAPQFDRPAGDASYYEIRDAGGAIVARSSSVRRTGRALVGEAEPYAAADADDEYDAPDVRDLPLPDGRPGRVVSFHFRPRLESDGSAADVAQPLLRAAVARDAGGLQHVLARVGWLLAALCAVTAAALALIARAVVGAGLRPVEALSAQIGRATLAERIDVAGLPRELAPIAAGSNAMLSRLAATFDRERAFTADAAHELRTPLAGLASALEVAASRPREPAAYARVIGDCLGVIRSMHRSVDDLLFLARADARPIVPIVTPTPLAPLVDAAWAPLEQAATARQLRLRARVEPPPLAWPIDRERVAHVLANLLDNAVRHAEPGVVDVDVRVVGEHLTIVVANAGSRVARADAGRVFNRFWRGDPARSPVEIGVVGGHSGLGLAICRNIVVALGGTIEAASELGGTFSIRVTLP